MNKQDQKKDKPDSFEKAIEEGWHLEHDESPFWHTLTKRNDTKRSNKFLRFCRMTNKKTGDICGKCISNKNKMQQHSEAKTLHLTENLKKMNRDDEHIKSNLNQGSSQDLERALEQLSLTSDTSEIQRDFADINGDDSIHVASVEETITKSNDYHDSIVVGATDTVIQRKQPRVVDIAQFIKDPMEDYKLAVYCISERNGIEFIPQFCPFNNECQKKGVTIISKGSYKRKHCYSTRNLLSIQVPQFQCRSCNRKCNLLNFTLPQHIAVLEPMSPNSAAIRVDLIVLDKTIITLDLYTFIIDLWIEHRNMSSITRLVEANLHHQYREYEHIMKLSGRYVKEEDLAKAILKMTLSRPSISRILEFWWISTGERLLTQQQQSLCRDSGVVIRLDHTYKAVSTFTVTENEQRFHYDASLFMVTNEKGFVMQSCIVPNDQRTYVFSVLSALFQCKDRNVVTKAVYTDNPKTDKSAIELAWKSSYLHDEKLIKEVPDVLQDIFHALSRVTLVMEKRHPDYSSARSELSAILMRLTVPNHYADLQAFKSALDGWLQRWATQHSPLSVQQAIVFLHLRNENPNADDNTLKTQAASTTQPIATDRVKSAVQNLKKEPYCTALFNITKHLHSGQGTSQNETVHSHLSEALSNFTSNTSMCFLEMMVGTAIYLFNRKKDINTDPEASKDENSRRVARYFNEIYGDHKGITIATTFFPHVDRTVVEGSLGYRQKKTQHTWTVEDLNTLNQAINDINAQPNDVHVKDLSYYINHYYFQGRISKASVQEKIFELTNNKQ